MMLNLIEELCKGAERSLMLPMSPRQQGRVHFHFARSMKENEYRVRIMMDDKIIYEWNRFASFTDSPEQALNDICKDLLQLVFNYGLAAAKKDMENIKFPTENQKDI